MTDKDTHTTDNELEATAWNYDEFNADRDSAKISELIEQKNENQKRADKLIEPIKAWLDEQNTRLDKEISYRSINIFNYYQMKREADPKFKFSNPYLKVSDRKGSTKLLVDDDDSSLKAYANENHLYDELFNSKPVLSKIKSLGTAVLDDGSIVDADGVVIPNVKAKEQPRSISFKVGGQSFKKADYMPTDEELKDSDGKRMFFEDNENKGE